MIDIGDGFQGKHRFKYTFMPKAGTVGSSPMLPTVEVEAGTLDDAIRRSCKQLTMSWSEFNTKYEIVSAEEITKSKKAE